MRDAMSWGGGARAALAGLAVTLLLMLALSAVAAALLQLTALSESLFPALATLINAVAMLGGGWMAGRLNGEKGLLSGLTVAALALILMLLLGGGWQDDTPLKIVYCALTAAIGGIFGVR